MQTDVANEIGAEHHSGAQLMLDSYIHLNRTRRLIIGVEHAGPGKDNATILQSARYEKRICSVRICRKGGLKLTLERGYAVGKNLARAAAASRGEKLRPSEALQLVQDLEYCRQQLDSKTPQSKRRP